MTTDDAKEIIKEAIATTNGDIAQYGCASAEINRVVYNYCRANHRMLHTYYIDDEQRGNCVDSVGKYHIVRQYQSTENLDRYEFVFNNL